jgi:lysophospholipase L1-like esterase
MAEKSSDIHHATRRGFLRTAAGVVALGAAPTVAPAARGRSRTAARGPGRPTIIKENNVILFQGDSITDAGRDRKREQLANDSSALGKGYAFLAACQLLVRHAGQGLKIYNRGISGHKVFQLAERWEKDCLSLKPDILSILIGVNDIWHKLNGHYDGTVETYENDFDALLKRTRSALPEVKLVICEPFVLRCGAVNDKWLPEFDRFRKAAKDIAAKSEAIFIPIQSIFDQAAEQAPPAYWAQDGVHPSMAGASLMAQAWVRAVGSRGPR